MTNDANRRTTLGALSAEIAAIEAAHDALPEDSHLRALCRFTSDRLREIHVGGAVRTSADRTVPLHGADFGDRGRVAVI